MAALIASIAAVKVCKKLESSTIIITNAFIPSSDAKAIMRDHGSFSAAVFVADSWIALVDPRILGVYLGERPRTLLIHQDH